MKFVVKGHIVPYTRMTQRGKHVKANAQRYLASQDAIGWQIREQMGGAAMYESGQRLALSVVFYLIKKPISDLSNQVKAIEDALQGIVYTNDLYIDSISARREIGIEEKTIIEVTPL